MPARMRRGDLEAEDYQGSDGSFDERKKDEDSETSSNTNDELGEVAGEESTTSPALSQPTYTKTQLTLISAEREKHIRVSKKIENLNARPEFKNKKLDSKTYKRACHLATQNGHKYKQGAAPIHWNQRQLELLVAEYKKDMPRSLIARRLNAMPDFDKNLKPRNIESGLNKAVAKGILQSLRKKTPKTKAQVTEEKLTDEEQILAPSYFSEEISY